LIDKALLINLLRIKRAFNITAKDYTRCGVTPTYVNLAPQYGSSSKDKRFHEKYYQNQFAKHMLAIKMDLVPSNIIMPNHAKSLPCETFT